MTAGLVIAAHGRRALLQIAPDVQQMALVRGRRLEPVVGDQVTLLAGAITAIAPRRNELTRSDQNKRRTIAANLDAVAYVIAHEPAYSEDLLLRVQLAATIMEIEFAVLANKVDLRASDHPLNQRLESLRALGIPVFELSAKSAAPAHLDQLRHWMTGRTTLLAGQSGMGKSTLLNLLVPDASQQTAEISQRLDSGRHTTTFTRMFAINDSAQTRIIDSPGFQQFALAHLSDAQLRYGALEFSVGQLRCRFNDCRHLDEPGCAIRESVQSGRLDQVRYLGYRDLMMERESSGHLPRR